MRRIRLALLLFACLPSDAFSFDFLGRSDPGKSEVVVLEVTEPFIEMHTGPGRGYPIFNVVEQGETIEILARQPDWYKVRSPDNKTGWTRAAQLEHTVTPSGVPANLPEVDHDDYLKSSWRVGFTVGQLEGDTSVSLTAGYWPFRWAGVELEGGKIFDESVTSDYYGVNLLAEPMPQWIVSPYFTIGAGKFSFNDRQKVVVDDAGSPGYVSFGAGAGYYIGRNFLLRGEYRWYSISTDGDRVGLNAWRIGLNTFF
jgi:hypothetical protein